MFKTPAARTAFRAALAALLSTLSAASAIWVDNVYIRLASAFVGTVALWYGIGATTSTEPFLGTNVGSSERVEVPADRVEVVNQ